MDKNKVLWHTIKLRIPSEMISIGKNGVMTVKQSLTKKNNIAKRLKEPSVILESDPNITEAKIIDKGNVENVDDIKERQGKLKRIRKKLETLPNKPPTTKDEFIKKSKEKVAPRVAQRKTMKDVSKQIEMTQQETQVKDHYKGNEDKIILSDPKTIMEQLKKIMNDPKDDRGERYYYGLYYYSYLKNNAHKAELYKQFGIKKMPPFKPSQTLLNTYRRYKERYEKEDENEELRIYRTKKSLEEAFERLRIEYKTSSKRRKTIIEKQYNELKEEYQKTTKQAYNIPITEN